MSAKIQKNYLIKPLLICFFSVIGCNNLEIIPNKSDYYKDAMQSKGNDIAEDTIPLTERLANLIRNEANISTDKSITFEVALNQFSIMPLVSVDRVGGVIITDWYSTSSNINERVKFNIFIKDEMMLSDSIEVIMFKEILSGSVWKQSSSNLNTADKIKEVILEKSRRLKATAELS